MKRKITTILGALAMLSATGTSASALDQGTVNGLERSRKAAERYYDIQAAVDAGYEPLFDCTANSEKGAMGQHYINPKFAEDAWLNIAQPDVLMYEPQRDGTMHLVALEYIIFEKVWKGKAAPVLLGRTLKRKTAVGKHPVDPFFEVHVWHWRNNPDGIFADYNPDVSCADAK